MSLHVAVSGWLLGPHSGANRRLLALLDAMAPLLQPDERITALVPQGAAIDLPRSQRLAAVEVRIPQAPSWRRALAERSLLQRELDALGADVLDHGFLPLPRVRQPVVLTVHDARDCDGLGRRPRQLARWLLRRAARHAACVITPSRFTAERLRAAGVHAPIEVIPNACAPSPIAAAPWHADGPLLHVGHLERRKNLDVVLAGLARLPAARRPELLLVGADHGDGGRLLRLARRLGIGDRVRRLGPLDDANLLQRYASARAVVVPSRYEGFSLPALEALAHDRPLLCADCGALPEVVGPAARLLPPDDAAAWAAAIESLSAGQGAAASDARLAQAAKFSWQASAGMLLSTWRRIAAR